MARTLHKMKPGAYDAPTTTPAEPESWEGPTSGPEFEAWLAKPVPEAKSSPLTPETLFACEVGDLMYDCAFEEFPPPSIFAELGQVTICPECWPDHVRR